MWRSVLQPASYYTGIVQQLQSMGVYGKELVVVEPLVLAALARQALGGTNVNLVTYAADTAPTVAVTAGSTLSFTVTVRNDGWAAVAADSQLCAGLVALGQAYTPSVCTVVGGQGIAEGGSWVGRIAGLAVTGVAVGQQAVVRFGLWTAGSGGGVAGASSFQRWGSADVSYVVQVL